MTLDCDGCSLDLVWVLFLPNSKTETLKSQNLKKTRHRRDMERRLKWKGTNDGGIQLHRADVFLSFFSRTGPLFFSNTSSSVLLFLSPPLLKQPSTFPSLRPLLCLSLPPLWRFVSYFSYSEFRIHLHSTSHLSAHPSGIFKQTFYILAAPG